jgi:hypothetical protein
VFQLLVNECAIFVPVGEIVSEGRSWRGRVRLRWEVAVDSQFDRYMVTSYSIQDMELTAIY